jgi:DNA-binding IclR family transcriptional regulator
VADLTQLQQMAEQHQLTLAEMQQQLAQYTANVNQMIADLKAAGQGGTVNLGTMFQLQFQMQQMSQYVEAVSNTLQAVHQEMMTMARATKGQ